jgi:hypothetical protein
MDSRPAGRCGAWPFIENEKRTRVKRAVIGRGGTVIYDGGWEKYLPKSGVRGQGE